MKQITILGAGLSGLLAGYQLKKLGFQIQVLEARNRIGGRIHTVLSQNETPVEMGATWFGDQHIHLLKLLNELEIPYFEQYMKGTAFFEAFSMALPQNIDIPVDNPSYRMAGGTSTLIHKLAENFSENEINLNQKVKELVFENDSVKIKTQNKIFESDIVISTLPPALLINSIEIKPSVSEELINISKKTHTWMQDSVKVALVYEKPFWRNKNRSGTLFSNVGPVTEFYDHSDFQNTKFALCGFVNASYTQFSEEERKEKVISQLQRIFGNEVLRYISFEEMIWSEEEFTKDKKQDEVFVYPHQNNGNNIFSRTYFDGRLYLGGAETASQFSGYMEGAVFSANKIVSKIRNQFLNY